MFCIKDPREVVANKPVPAPEVIPTPVMVCPSPLNAPVNRAIGLVVMPVAVRLLPSA